jgi:hypothetical protein
MLGKLPLTTFARRDKPEFRVRPVAESVEDLEGATRDVRPHVEKLCVADGYALVMDVAH